MRIFSGIGELGQAAGQELGVTDWLLIDQRRVNTFADATDDKQWIHVDPEAAAAGPFGGTIAHGLLTLSLLPVFHHQLFEVQGVKMAVNYGLGKVRFPAPVLVGSHLRASSRISHVEVLQGAVQVRLETVIEIEHSPKPACVAEAILRYVA